MNIFKGLLFLHGHMNPANPASFADDVDAEARYHYGARTAAAELAPPLGNRAASRRWFKSDPSAQPSLPEAGCVTGGCG